MRDPAPPPCGEAGLPEPEPFTPERIAQIARAIGNPTRVEIISQFDGCSPHMALEIVSGCTLAQSTVSEHLRILREADVVFATKDGPRTWYCLRRSVLERFAEAIADLAVVSPHARVGEPERAS